MSNNGVAGLFSVCDKLSFRAYSKCLIQCEKGGVPNELCECDCPFPWGGKLCDECPKDCKHGSVKNEKKCSCECVGAWAGPECDVCNQKPCKNGGFLNSDKCECQCLEIFGGDTCEECGLKCANGGSAVSGDCGCSCNCANAWGGLQCDECSAACKNGATLDEDNCKCHCTASFIGNDCSVCPVTDDYCKNGAETDLNDGHMNSMVKIGGAEDCYWQVDLGLDYNVYGVLVQNYYDACKPHPFEAGKVINEEECSKLDGAVVTISDNANPLIPGQAAPAAAVTSPTCDPLENNGKHLEDYASAPKLGRYVRVSGVAKLMLSEVQVYGMDPIEEELAAAAAGGGTF